MDPKIKAELINSFVNSFEPPYTGSVDQWAHTYVELGANYAIMGKFDIDISKYLIEPFKDLRNNDITQINLIAATQTAKTLVSEIFIPFVIVNDAGPVLRLHQSDEMATMFVQTRLLPLLEKCKPVKAMLDHDRYSAKKSGINLPHMAIKIAGAKENVLHGQSVRYLLADECWLYDSNVIEKAKARTTAFGRNKKILLTSQPGLEGDQLDGENNGIEYTWGWQCPHCNNTQPYYWSKEKPDGSWAGIVWQKHYTTEESSSYDYQKTGDSARLQCYYCTGSVADTEANRRYLNDTGKYIITADKGDNHIHTYTWCAFVNQKITFKEKVIQYLQAIVQNRRYGTTDALRIFTQQVLGKPWRISAAIDQSKVLVQTFNPDAAWPDQVFRCIAVDYQKKYGMKFFVVAAFSRKEIRILEHGYVSKWDEIAALADKWKIPPPAIGVDSGYNAVEVYLESVNHGKIVKVGNKIERVGWTCMKGEDKDDGYYHKGPNDEKVLKYFSPLTRAAVNNNQFARLFRWGNFPIKNILFYIKEGKSDMKLILPTPDPDFSNQLNAEALQEVIDAKTGLKKLRWEKIHDDNHYLDCMAMAIVLCMMSGKFGEEPSKLVLPPPPTKKAN